MTQVQFLEPIWWRGRTESHRFSFDLHAYVWIQTNTKQKTVQETCANFNDMVKGLKEKEELRAGFIRNLTHDLRTPLIAQERALSMISGKFSELNLDEEKELAKSLEKNTSHL